MAAFARFPMLARQHPYAAGWLAFSFVAILALYDLWSLHKLHPATLWAGAFMLFVQQVRWPIARSAAWHHAANWIYLHVR